VLTRLDGDTKTVFAGETSANRNLELASRNLEGVKLVAPHALQPYDLLRHDHLVLSKERPCAWERRWALERRRQLLKLSLLKPRSQRRMPWSRPNENSKIDSDENATTSQQTNASHCSDRGQLGEGRLRLGAEPTRSAWSGTYQEPRAKSQLIFRYASQRNSIGGRSAGKSNRSWPPLQPSYQPVDGY